MHEAHRFATRLNSFASKPEAFWPAGHGKPTPFELAERASKVAGLTDVDLNYPDHLGPDPRATGDAIRSLGLAVNGLAMRYYSNPAFKIGAFTNPDPAVRREAIDLTKRGIDAAREAGCNLMTLWLGQDGFDYAFQAEYARLWRDEVDGIREVAEHDPACRAGHPAEQPAVGAGVPQAHREWSSNRVPIHRLSRLRRGLGTSHVQSMVAGKLLPLHAAKLQSGRACRLWPRRCS